MALTVYRGCSGIAETLVWYQSCLVTSPKHSIIRSAVRKLHPSLGVVGLTAAPSAYGEVPEKPNHSPHSGGVTGQADVDTQEAQAGHKKTP